MPIADRHVLHADSWAPRTIDAVLKFADESPVHRDNQSFAVERITIEDPDQFSILFEVDGHEGILGLRLRSDMSIDEIYGLVEDESVLPFDRATPEDNGFDIVTDLLAEPFGDDDLTEPDEDGVRWLRLHEADYEHRETWLRRIARRTTRS
ncbi:hypothetical protein [Spelaeicoccus albus]|uniref:Uncharacterized protein n=1 Tax=Spelaeicoccus albus TaxID=1280376 RepID=A0A7Z0IJ83_9MICO|nr:hypothetical protein [Spelaeicoccus albus]NYI69259.1 hypothetical protein [Spelaeicoccus albus]